MEKSNEYEYLVKHLSQYGNTCISSNPEKYLQRLKEDGYDCNVRKVKEMLYDQMGMSATHTRRSKYFYIVEVKR